jgi:hypothetical protein
MMELHSRADPAGATGSDGAGLKGRILVAVLLISAAAEACADEHPRIEVKSDALRPARPLQAPGAALSLDARLTEGRFAAPVDVGRPLFSPTEFTPRKHTLFDQTPADGDAVPMLRGTNVWQRMGDYRARDRVRLLTLWESTGSAVSLQAGKHGDPSLQWTSSTMNRGGATKGLLDKLFSASIAGAEQTLHAVSRSKTPAPASSGAMIAELK